MRAECKAIYVLPRNRVTSETPEQHTRIGITFIITVDENMSPSISRYIPERLLPEAWGEMLFQQFLAGVDEAFADGIPTRVSIEVSELFLDPEPVVTDPKDIEWYEKMIQRITFNTIVALRAGMS